MEGSNDATGMLINVKPTNFQAFAADTDVQLNAGSQVTLLKNPQISLFQIQVNLSAVNAITGENVIFPPTVITSAQNSAVSETTIKLTSLDPLHRDAATGWYIVTATLSIRKQVNGEYQPAVILDSQQAFYKVGEPAENIPYGEVTTLSPSSVMLPAGQDFGATAKFKISVHDNPQGHRYRFDVTAKVIDPNGVVAGTVTDDNNNTLSGGGSRDITLNVPVGGVKAIQGNWQTIATIEAIDIDQLGAQKQVLRNVFTTFSVGGDPPSSSSSSSSSSGESSSSSSSSSGMSPSSSSSSSSSSYYPSSSSTSSSSYSSSSSG